MSHHPWRPTWSLYFLLFWKLVGDANRFAKLFCSCKYFTVISVPQRKTNGFPPSHTTKAQKDGFRSHTPSHPHPGRPGERPCQLTPHHEHPLGFSVGGERKDMGEKGEIEITRKWIISAPLKSGQIATPGPLPLLSRFGGLGDSREKSGFHHNFRAQMPHWSQSPPSPEQGLLFSVT